MGFVYDVGDAIVDAAETVHKEVLKPVGNYVSGPFEKIYHGDVSSGLFDMFKKFTPAGVIYEKLDTAVQSHVHVANASEKPITVIVSADKNWAFADIGTSLALLVASAGSSAPSGLKAMRSATTLWELYQATRYMRGAASLTANAWKLFSEKGTRIEHGQFQDLQQRSQSNPMSYMDPSQWGHMAGAKDISIMIMREDGHTAFFSSNSDTSWIAYPPGYCRAIHGTIWQPADGPHNWDA